MDTIGSQDIQDNSQESLSYRGLCIRAGQERYNCDYRDKRFLEGNMYKGMVSKVYKVEGVIM